MDKGLCDFQFSFLEVFSGLRAPLTSQAKLAHTLLMREVNELRSLSSPLAETAKTQNPEKDTPIKLSNAKPITNYQRAALHTGWQPKWNPNYQLICDGLNDQVEHLR